MMPIAYCLLPIVYRLLPIAYCLRPLLWYNQWCAETGRDERAPEIEMVEEHIAGARASKDRHETEPTQGHGTPHPDEPPKHDIERKM